MYCNECLSTIKEGEKFCTNCGTPVKSSESMGEIIDTLIVEEEKNHKEINSEGIQGLDHDISEISDKVNLSELEETEVEENIVPKIQIDPKTGKSILPDKIDHKLKAKEAIIEEKLAKVEDRTKEKLKAREQFNQVSEPSQYKRVKEQSIYDNYVDPKSNIKKDKTVDYIVGISGVALSYISSLVGGIFMISMIVLMTSGGTQNSPNVLGNAVWVILSLKGFVFATIGLIGVLNIKKNSTVAAVFFLSAAVGSFFSLQFIRFAVFFGAAILSFNHHEKTEKPLKTYIIKAFTGTVLVLLLVFLTFIGFIASDIDEEVDYNTVNEISQYVNKT